MTTVAPRIIPINVPDTPYPAVVAPGLLNNVGALLRERCESKKAAVVTDSNVEHFHLQTLSASLQAAGFELMTAVVPAGEQHKTLRDLELVYDRLLSAGIERKTPLLALGGGLVGDVAGFVAATTLRGIPFFQVPTSLLAMVDASVGGKTGVNHAVGKNLIGAFYQPSAVWIDPAALKTLPPGELRDGLAECIKHEIIRDAAGFERLEQNIHRALERDVDYLAQLVAHNVQIKAAVVSEDPKENGVRAHLNFGHTFGHAVERVSKYSYTHGQSVAIGMAAAMRLAVKLGLVDALLEKRVTDLIQKAGLPIRANGLDPAEVVRVMSFDKKVKAGKIGFILPTELGRVVVRDDVTPAQALESIKEIWG